MLIEKDLFKDKELIARINFNTLKPNNIKTKLEKTGWIIVEDIVDKKVNVKMFEDSIESDFGDFLCECTDKTFNKAFVGCLKIIQDYYEKVS